MPDEPNPHDDRTRRNVSPPPARLVHEARASLRATVVYADALRDRVELACAFKPEQLDGIPAELLLQLTAVSEAFQEGARHTLWFIEPELARSAQVIAGLARDGAGRPPAEGCS
ncbi:MAG TPA: hypothetical protein VKB25_03900 [Conexibacter sp.]|nr:hypothetical protein [Conexibacter sp.]